MTTDLQVIENKERTMSSKEIAEVTGKQHSHIMRDIKKQLEQQGISQSIYGSTYLDAQQKERACFNLDYDQTMILVSGYSIPLRAKIIKRWRELEEAVKPSYLIEDQIQRAEAWIIEQKEKKQLLLVNQEQEKRVKRLVHNNETYSSTELAKELGFRSASAFNKDLHEKGIQFKDAKGVWVPYAEYSDMGLTSIKQKEIERSTGEIEVKYFRAWTGIGRDYLLGLYSKREAN